MKCPKCDQSELTPNNGQFPYACKQCGGIWLVSDKIAQLSAVLDGVDAEVSAGGNNDDRTGLCPSGHGVMIRAKVDMDEPFYLEKCIQCGGIWFDKGEWRRIAETQLAENLDVIWSKSWQRRQRQEKNRDKFLEMNQRLLGDDVYHAIVGLAEKLKESKEKSRAIAFLQQLSSE